MRQLYAYLICVFYLMVIIQVQYADFLLLEIPFAVKISRP